MCSDVKEAEERSHCRGPTSKDNEDVRRSVSADPILGLSRNPRRRGRFRRSKQDEKQGLIEGVADTRPERWIYCEIALISENVRSAQPIPGFGKTVQGRLKGGCKRTIGSMAVRDERVVGHQSS